MDRNELDTQALVLVEQAKAIRVRDDQEYRTAADFLLGAKALQKEIKATFDPIVEAAHKAHKQATESRKAMLEPVEAAERVVKTAMAGYVLEQEKAKRALEEEARLKAEADRARIVAEAEKQVEAGEMAEATATLRQIYDIEPAKIEITPKVQGISSCDVWRFEITDIRAIPPEFLVVDEKAIGAVVRAMKDKTNIPGIRVYAKKIMAAAG